MQLLLGDIRSDAQVVRGKMLSLEYIGHSQNNFLLTDFINTQFVSFLVKSFPPLILAFEFTVQRYMV